MSTWRKTSESILPDNTCSLSLVLMFDAQLRYGVRVGGALMPCLRQRTPNFETSKDQYCAS